MLGLFFLQKQAAYCLLLNIMRQYGFLLGFRLLFLLATYDQLILKDPTGRQCSMHCISLSLERNSLWLQEHMMCSINCQCGSAAETCAIFKDSRCEVMSFLFSLSSSNSQGNYFLISFLFHFTSSIHHFSTASAAALSSASPPILHSTANSLGNRLVSSISCLILRRAFLRNCPKTTQRTQLARTMQHWVLILLRWSSWLKAEQASRKEGEQSSRFSQHLPLWLASISGSALARQSSNSSKARDLTVVRQEASCGPQQQTFTSAKLAVSCSFWENLPQHWHLAAQLSGMPQEMAVRCVLHSEVSTLLLAISKARPQDSGGTVFMRCYNNNQIGRQDGRQKSYDLLEGDAVIVYLAAIYLIQLMEATPIICDPGTGYMKMGFAGDNFPKASFASLVGRPMLRFEESLGEGVQLKEVMIGNDASKYRSLLELSYPTSEGIVKSWEDMELLMKYSFQQIGVNDPRNSSVFLTEAIMNPVANKVGMMELMFEKFQVNRIQYGMQALMSLFAEGMETAMLLDSGDGVTHCIPVFDGNIIKASFERLEIAGRHVTSHLLKLLHQRGYAFNSTSDFEIVREIKEKFCFVSGDIMMDRKMALETCVHEKEYKLPDGEVVKVGRERFLAPEILMNPGIAGIEHEGCGEMVFKSINSCDMNLKKEFYGNILISGGTSMIPGFPTRLKEEVESRFRERVLKGAATNTSAVKIRVIDPPTRRYNVFIGASIIAKETDKYAQAWTFKREYEEKGKNRLAQELNMKAIR